MHALRTIASTALSALAWALLGTLILLVAQPSRAAVNTTKETRTVQLKRGSTNIATTATLAECEARAAALIASDAATKTYGSSVYTCADTIRWAVSFKAGAPAPTCTAPRPATEGKTMPCPAPTVGTWSQTREPVAMAYPTCWGTGEWLPTTPAPGICAAPPAETWIACATEYGRCSFTGTRRVRYGTGSTWIVREFTGGVACTNAAFGADPAPGASKRCELGSGTAPPAPSGSATISWGPPTRNVDGTALTDLVGYQLAYGTDAAALNQVIELPNPSLSSYIVDRLYPATYYFALRSIDSFGTKSALSNVTSKTIP